MYPKKFNNNPVQGFYTFKENQVISFVWEWPKMKVLHCVKAFHIRSYSGPYIPAFGLDTERMRIQSECG